MKNCNQANCKFFQITEYDANYLNLPASRTCRHCTHNRNATAPTHNNWVLKNPVGGCNKVDCTFYSAFDNCPECKSCWHNPHVLNAKSGNYLKA